MWACFTDLIERHSQLATAGALVGGKFSIRIIVAVLLVHLTLVGAFTYVLVSKLKRPSPSAAESENELEFDERVKFELPDETEDIE